jgi:hypothetical protein
MRTKDATWHLQRVTYIAWLVAFLAWKVVEPRPKPTCQSRILPTGNKVTTLFRPHVQLRRHVRWRSSEAVSAGRERPGA